MSGPAGFLEFFILEASDYVEQLDRLLLGGNTAGLDADGVQRAARALRGTATMAKIPSFADLASGVERAGRALQEGAVQWSPALGGVLVAAIDDLKLLLHSARTWSAAEDERAAARLAELAKFIPTRHETAPAGASPVGGAPATSSGTAFLATEAANIAAGLELLTTRAGDPDTAANVLRRVRALRGVAGVKEVPPLADALEGTEDAARGLESGEPMTDDARQLLERAAAFLRALSVALRTGQDVNAASPERLAFTAAHDAWGERDADRELVVPIATLFYDDGAPGVLEASAHPPTSADERFRLELVSLGEHLRQVVDAARKAPDTAGTGRAKRDLRRALRALQSAAESFGRHDVAAFIGTHVDGVERLDFLSLAALDDLAALASDPGAGGERLAERTRAVEGGRVLTSAIAAGFGDAPPPSSGDTSSLMEPAVVAPPPFVPAGPAAPAPPPVPVAPPIAAALATEALDQTSAAIIDRSIAAIDALTATPFLAPVAIPEDAVVPIESLLYRGRAALDRAVEIRDALRATSSGSSSDPTALEELFDLLELARTE